jgi:hypothetical protein
VTSAGPNNTMATIASHPGPRKVSLAEIARHFRKFC